MGGEPGLTVEQQLALTYVPRSARANLDMVWRLDARMRGIFAGSGDPAITEIKLAWWQERLALRGAVPAEPLLQALAILANDHPSAAASLQRLAEAWRELPGDWLATPLAAYAGLRGRGMVGLGARILGAEAGEEHLLAGEGWALADLARLPQAAPHRSDILVLARERFARAGRPRWPRAWRPVGMVVALARGDAISPEIPLEGSPVRVARMAWHALTGR